MSILCTNMCYIRMFLHNVLLGTFLQEHILSGGWHQINNQDRWILYEPSLLDQKFNKEDLFLSQTPSSFFHLHLHLLSPYNHHHPHSEKEIFTFEKTNSDLSPQTFNHSYYRNKSLKHSTHSTAFEGICFFKSKKFFLSVLPQKKHTKSIQQKK